MTSPLCKYKDVLGKPGEGFHSLRVYDIAILDVIGTILLGIGLAYIYSLGTPSLITLIICIIIMFIIGIVSHDIFCVETTIAKYLNNILENK